MPSNSSELPSQKQELARLRASSSLNQETDECLERALKARLTFEESLYEAMAILRRHVGARFIAVRTWDESLQLRDFVLWDVCDGQHADKSLRGDVDLEAAFEHAESGKLDSPHSNVLLHRLDVAGEMFGCAVLGTDDGASDETLALQSVLLETWCEELDNYLAAIARARKKHQITQALSAALKNPVLEVGTTEAVAVLQHEVGFTDLLLAYIHESDEIGESLNYQIYRDGEVIYDSFSQDRRLEIKQTMELFAFVHGQNLTFPERFGFSAYREDVLINGVREEQVVGRVLIANAGGNFNTFERDLLECFVDYVRQRIVDFNREWKSLAHTFARRDAMRLLATENYQERFLTPRERDVAVMFCDISGFTRLSEQVLRKPNLIGELIDTWSAEVVRIIWRADGVFDKMVGDCIIGLWGPPFFEMSASDACAKALEASINIRAYTARLSEDLPSVAAADFTFGVATGVNYCPLFVGTFGPNEDYTGFSSGMNNTARLQGVAGRDEILCMEEFVHHLPRDARFSELLEERVKNVVVPLQFRRLLDP